MASTIQEVIEIVTRNTQALDRLIEQNEDLADATRDANSQTKKSSEGMKLLNDVVGAYLSFQFAKKLRAQAIEMGELGAKSKFVAKNFDNFAKNEGKSYGKMMDSMRNATSGMISDLELQQLSMQAMVGGVDFEQMVVAMEYVSAQALATGQDVASKMQTVMTGLARGSAQFLDDVGIQVMGAKDVVGAAVEQMKEKVGIFGDASESALGKIAASKTDIENIRAKIGEELIPVAREWYTLMSNIATATRLIFVDGLKGSTYNAASKFAEELATEQRNAYSTMKKMEKLKVAQRLELELEKYKEISETVSMMEKSIRSQIVTRSNILASAKNEQETSEEIVSLREEQRAIDKEIEKRSGGKIKSAADYMDILRDSAIFMKNMGISATKIKFDKVDQDALDAKKAAAAKKLADEAALEKLYEKARQDRLMKNYNDEQRLIEGKEARNIAFNDKVISDAEEMEALITQIKKDGVKARADEEQKARERFKESAQMMVTGINQISRARQQSAAMDSQKEIEAIQKSTMSEKKKEKEIAKIQQRTRDEQEKTANVAWAATSALATANAAAAVIDVIKNMPTGPIGKLAAGATIGATVFGLAAQVASSKPKFYNGGDIPFNGNNRDTQEVMVRSGEKILNPVEARRYNAGITNNKKSVSNTYITIHADAGVNTAQVESVVRSTLPRALEDGTRTNSIDWDKVGVMTA